MRAFGIMIIMEKKKENKDRDNKSINDNNDSNIF